MKRGEPIDVLYVQVFFSSGLGGLLLGVLFLCSKKSLSSASKASPFECGFWPHKSSRLPFSLQFFLIALIFLVFDVELIFIFPLLLSHYCLLSVSGWALFVFITIVAGGLAVEWSQGSLEWIK